jgi:beta-galactosidase
MTRFLSFVISALLMTGQIVVGNQVCAANEQTILTVDASAPVTEPTTDHLHLSASPAAASAPNGDKISINNQYLEFNGIPWLPVMGEFHYSRVPADRWEAELQKMKSAGISIVSSYVIWSHHEEAQGHFDWQGNRDLNRFLRLCKKTGLYAVVRIGPWSHAEVRFGGIPDWVVNAMPTRSDDPQYLHYVGRLYTQIGQQLNGQLWKQGGPVIGIQIENEYNLTGAMQGAQHIHTLKNMAVKAGMDVPLYTVTGWDGTVYPQGEVVPVFGGYPDEPWGLSQKELPPKETYAFRFNSRVSGDLGAQTSATAIGTAESDIHLTPFLGAEYGAGLPAMYRRRTVVSADDIAAMLPVQLGSGVNLMGYYMFHGGRNPMSMGGTPMQESTASGGYNDTPMISYDFQAPLGPDGQQRKVLELLRPYHYFLQDFGATLAPMSVRKPELVPANETDMHDLRWSVRSKGNSGFLFVNNHVRQYAMDSHDQVKFSVRLQNQTVTFPEQAVTINDGSYFIWPINLDMNGVTLRYATAQLVARLDNGAAGLTYVFTATQGSEVELGFDRRLAPYLTAQNAQIIEHDDQLVVHQHMPENQTDGAVILTINQPKVRPVTMLILSPQQTQHLAIGMLAGQRRVLISEAQDYFADAGVELHSVGTNKFHVAVSPSLSVAELRALKTSRPVSVNQQPGEFQQINAEVPAVPLAATTQLIRDAKEAPAILIGGAAKAAIEPKPESFSSAAAWKIGLPPAQLQKAWASKDVTEVLCEIDFVGDIGRLFSGTDLIDDWYYWGYGWQIGLKKFAAQIKSDPALTLSVLPLRADAPIYLPAEYRPDFFGKTQIARLNKVTLTPVYKLTMH